MTRPNRPFDLPAAATDPDFLDVQIWGAAMTVETSALNLRRMPLGRAEVDFPGDIAIATNLDAIPCVCIYIACAPCAVISLVMFLVVPCQPCILLQTITRYSSSIFVSLPSWHGAKALGSWFPGNSKSTDFGPWFTETRPIGTKAQVQCLCGACLDLAEKSFWWREFGTCLSCGSRQHYGTGARPGSRSHCYDKNLSFFPKDRGE